MVLRKEVAYKLTKDTIDALAKHHKKVYCVNVANTCDWPDRKQWCKKLHEYFIQEINKIVFRTHVSALEGLEEGGTGELINGKSEEVKGKILSLIKHPRPRVGDVTQQTSVFPEDNAWLQHGMQSSQLPVELWGVPPSSSSVASPASTDNCLVCVSMAQSNPAPAPAFTQPHPTTSLSYNSPQETALIPTMPLSGISAAAQCGVSMAMSEMGGSYSFGWDRYQKCAATILQEDSLSSVVVSSSEYDFPPSFMPKALG
ncbi:hypothetical protein LRP88_12983 [Fusarium phalaenopsidis]